MRVYRVIQIHTDAPDKPPEGEPCNGCGVCCASEPCPIGVLASGRRHGACAALVWVDAAGAYRCGLIHQPAVHLPALLRRSAPLLTRLAARFISAGSGCDCNLSVEHLSEAPKLHAMKARSAASTRIKSMHAGVTAAGPGSKVDAPGQP